MIRKLGAALILVGLFLPYSCDIAPVGAVIEVPSGGDALGWSRSGVPSWSSRSIRSAH